MAQMFVAAPADPGVAGLAGLVADRRGAGHALEALGILVEGAVAADPAKQPRRDLGSRGWQGTEHAAAGVAGEERRAALPAGLDLPLQHPQLPAARHRQEALGGDDRGAGLPLVRPLEGGDAFRIGLRAEQFVAVGELVPFALAGPHEVRGAGEGLHEGPGPRVGPAVEGLRGRRVVSVRGLLELVDQARRARR